MATWRHPGTPNFELVADILDWLLHRFEPGIAIPDDISPSAVVLVMPSTMLCLLVYKAN
jgi:hypothetical protein